MNDSDRCVICLESLKINHCKKNKSKYLFVTLLCEHIFHKNCINKYFKEKKDNLITCPICRDLVKESNDIFDEISYDIYEKYDRVNK